VENRCIISTTNGDGDFGDYSNDDIAYYATDRYGDTSERFRKK
jgi:hypothetical protein